MPRVGVQTIIPYSWAGLIFSFMFPKAHGFALSGFVLTERPSSPDAAFITTPPICPKFQSKSCGRSIPCGWAKQTTSPVEICSCVRREEASEFLHHQMMQSLSLPRLFLLQHSMGFLPLQKNLGQFGTSPGTCACIRPIPCGRFEHLRSQRSGSLHKRLGSTPKSTFVNLFSFGLQSVLVLFLDSADDH